jgi:putative N6-adenine-specific DNA methylase
VKVRIEDDLCTVSLDTSGEPLHRRGHKQFVGKAPLRETMAAAFLWQMGFDGTQTVVDPMCGSGTIPLEAAEIAAGLVPGRDRFRVRGDGGRRGPRIAALGGLEGGRFFGFDRDQGAVQGALKNAERAGVSDDLQLRLPAAERAGAAEGPPGHRADEPALRRADRQPEDAVRALRQPRAVLGERFGGWRVGIVTSDDGLAKALACR